jgi:hypothetical protein
VVSEAETQRIVEVASAVRYAWSHSTHHAYRVWHSTQKGPSSRSIADWSVDFELRLWDCV